MAEGDITFTNHFKEQLLLKALDLDTDTIKVCLVGNGYSWSVDGNQSYNDTAITTNELTAANYSAGGEALTALTVSQDDANDWAKWDAANVTWGTLGTTGKTLIHALIYDDTITTPVAKPIIGRIELATNPTGGNYQIAWNAGGILQLS